MGKYKIGKDAVLGRASPQQMKAFSPVNKREAQCVSVVGSEGTYAVTFSS